MVLFAATILRAQSPNLTDLAPAFKIEVVMPGALVGELPEAQIEKDIELVLRRNGVPVGGEAAGQILQLTLRAVAPEDRTRYAINLRLELLTIGYTLGTVVACAGKPASDSCWKDSARRIGYWSDERLLLLGQAWTSETRQGVKDLAESFALYYLRRKQKAE